MSQPAPSEAFVIAGPVAAADVPLLCERLRDMLTRTADDVVVCCDIRALPADATTIEALARLQLTARRLGRRIRLLQPCPDLDRLVAFVGLADVLPCHTLGTDDPAVG